MKHPAQEPDAVPGRTIAGVAAAVVVATIIGVLIAYGIASCGTTRTTTRSTNRAEINHMETAVFAAEAQGLEDARRAEAHLASYGWVDRDREIAHVPLAVAIEVYLARRRDVSSPVGGLP